MGIIRLSLEEVNLAPFASDSVTMVLNLYILKGLPPLPTRSWIKKADPFELSFMTMNAKRDRNRIMGEKRIIRQHSAKCFMEE